jgi:tetratricopeptide (TPR) repeat protein
MYIYDEAEQRELIEGWGWPEDSDWRQSFENDSEFWGYANALEKVHEIASVDFRESGTLGYSLLRTYDVLVIGSFVESYSSTEVDAIVKFVKNGGGLLMLADRDNPNNSVSREFDVLFHSETVAISDENIEEDSEIRFTIEDRGIALFFYGIYYVSVDDITEHPITEGIEEFILYLGIPIVSYNTGTVVARTHEETWADESGGNMRSKEKDEDEGPFDILLAMEMDRGRAAFFGSLLSFRNVIIEREEQNTELLAQAVKWLGEPGGPYKQYTTVNEQAQQKLSDAVSLYSSYKASDAKSAFEDAIGLFEESREIYPNAEANNGIEEAQTYIEKCETGIEADEIFGTAEDLYEEREYRKAIEQYEKATLLYQDIEYTEKVEECTDQVDQSNQWILLREEATSLYEQAEEALKTAPDTVDPAGYQAAKSLFEESKRKWEEYDEPVQVELCAEKIAVCNDEIAAIEKTRAMVIVIIVVVVAAVVVVVLLVRRRKPEPVIGPPDSYKAPPEELDALAALEDRYARGDITREEYEKLKSLLEE